MFAKKPDHVEGTPQDGWYMARSRLAITFPDHRADADRRAAARGSLHLYGNIGAGVEFFPNVEPDYGLLYVHARGNMSLEEKDTLTRMAEERILGWPGIKSVYTRVGKAAARQ
jgi:multidrug efflux pump